MQFKLDAEEQEIEDVIDQFQSVDTVQRQRIEESLAKADEQQGFSLRLRHNELLKEAGFDLSR